MADAEESIQEILDELRAERLPLVSEDDISKWSRQQRQAYDESRPSDEELAARRAAVERMLAEHHDLDEHIRDELLFPPQLRAVTRLYTHGRYRRISRVLMMIPIVFLVLPTVVVFARCSKRA